LPEEFTQSTPAAAAASTARAAGPVPSKGPERKEFEWLTIGIPLAAIQAAASSNSRWVW
jgi:hypothetical protein